MALYKKAGDILEKLEAQKGTVRSLCLADDVKDKKRTYALVCETLKYKEVLAAIIKTSDLLKHEKKIPPSVATVLTYDLLFGKGISGGGTFKPLIQKHKTRLQAELAKIKVKRKVKDNEELVPERIRNAVILPRYIRVNTLKTTLQKVTGHFQSQSYTLLLDGSIIIQDKASCFPAYILSPPKGTEVIDGCAAPGNKTSHLSMIMGGTGRIYAFDMDKRRLGTLKKLCGRAGCKSKSAGIRFEYVWHNG
ncbi:putative 28S rRNA (cytosine-C(5))-methyltransferase [Rhizophlyctis rosea]|uniref:28S rRNA (Cytosine-C(5))-methyltransferase n=1 Tax=Rhizophlyctis rosea TaxID=64517 RepID=A0AAD5SHU2_9FUNG|nr:putative 28S rRNA (cytosine-C(5))-methyltransferase [Rhizophlyctis rosea]